MLVGRGFLVEDIEQCWLWLVCSGGHCAVLVGRGFLVEDIEQCWLVEAF